jgi:hypothetical protein
MITNNIKILSFLFLAFICQSSTCQTSVKLESKFNSSSYIINDELFSVCEVTFRNIQNTDIVFWFDNAQINKGKNEDKEIVSSYFHNVTDDFSLYNLMTEKLLKDQPPIVFKSFLKKLEPNEVFTLKIIGDSITTKKCEQFINYHLFIISLTELQEQLKLPDAFFVWYKPKSIELTEGSVP